MSPRMGRTRSSAIILACLWVLAAAAPALAQEQGGFVERPFPESSSFTLDDIGVVDYDQDGNLDVFSSNHLTRQLLLRGNGRGSFQDRLDAVRLNHTPDFPGWEEHDGTPGFTSPGLYVYRQGGVALRALGTGPVSGEIRFLTPVAVTEAGGAQLSLSRDTSRNPARNVVRFSIPAGTTVRLRPESSTLRTEVAVDPPLPLARVFVGPRAIRPSARQFGLYVNDRHGLAWADYNRDGHLDVYITRGGVSGNIKRYGGLVADELMLGDGSVFRDSIAGTGIRKGSCRARGAAAVDFDRDGRLDVFAACFGGGARLHRQRPNGRFKDVSGRLRKAGVDGHSVVWLDLDGRGGPELLVARKGRFVVYKRKRKRFKQVQRFRGRHGSNVQKFTVADFDNDGDADVFAASRTGNTLLVNRRGRLRPRNPRAVGLPRRALTANWVDHDNDGLSDLHLIPGGLYRQNGRGRFRPTGLAQPAAPPVRAIASWFDFDNDGARDALLAVREQGGGRFTSLRLLANAGPAGRWLQMELEGPAANRQAVGAKVTARVRGRTLTQWVGQSEGSHLSQGHFRLYFGLGSAASARVKVRWPDGRVQRLGVVAADQLLRVRR